MKPALLVIDIQNAWLDETPELNESMGKRIDVVNQAIKWFRERSRPVIVIYHEDRERSVVPGTRAFEFTGSVQIQADDLKVTKHYPNSFNRTGLDSILRKLGCDTVLIVGLSASGCALATYFGAWDYDFRPMMVKGGIASHSEEHVGFAEDLCETVTVDQFDRVIG